MARFFRVRNWERFQHYKDRSPPWIKLYTSWPDNYDWSQLSDASKLLAVCTMMLAGRSDNKIPLDLEWIRERCSLRKTPDLTELFSCQFIEEIQDAASDSLAVEQVASKLLAKCSSETETETEKKKVAIAPPSGLNPEAWETWLTYRNSTPHKILPASVAAAQRKLAGFGSRQAEVVENSIANSYRGLFAPDKKAKGDDGWR